LEELIGDVLEKTGYAKSLEEEGTEEAQARLDNIGELISKAVLYEEGNEDPTLSEFLEEVALVADVDSLEDGDNRVLLMTLHSAKGLEFPYVSLVGMEDGIFPSYMSIAAENPMEEIEEERRLCYVGITRAMKELTITAVRVRMIRGENHYNNLSRFVREIPRELIGQRSAVPPEPKVRQVPADSAYAKAKEAFRTKTFDPKQFQVVKADRLDYGVGDRVSHVKFGEGVVLDITEGGRDFEVKVEFDRAGIKKMFASFAKLKKVESL
ncbi:MAG: ATP-dependent DNA helicase PcrA, partial [Lachnospiraceae bacterium]|nr:ATP-dependent DNA helicase PcrA [Lachnospiraceae bacterium]